MKTINRRELVKLLAKADFILGSFCAHPKDGWKQGYQLSIGVKVPLLAGKKRVGERMEYHAITFGELPDEKPDVRMHASYGDKDAIRILLIAAINSQSTGRMPQFTVRPTTGCGVDKDGNERVWQYTIPGENGGPPFVGTVYSATIGSAYLAIASTFDYANRYGNNEFDWNRVEEDREERDTAHMHYTFDPSEPKAVAAR